MKLLSFAFFLLSVLQMFCCSLCEAGPVTRATAVVIDAAPSVVSYQGSSHEYTKFVIAPMGRSLGYVEPLNLNHTVHRTAKVRDNFDFLNVTPIYVPQ
ncbi:uncharacterized protein LOC119672066 [Teleopsis dalmanni]|uniref:uncharacterized protein LOC119672066 n=1 Tax=Teleopsis dalmanni TaxID=139649 RepID=UPI0018CFD086|nr:uncharacterized protein LOC119672066 [Teleopsis dalmanni]